MKMKMRKTVAFLLVAAMLVMNMGAMVVAAAKDEGGNKETAAEKVASPSANPKAGTYDTVQNVTLTSATKDAVIYYTVNGDTPSEKSTKYDSKKPIEVEETATVKAIAVKDGMTKSDVASFAYTIKADEKTETPAETAAPAETAVPEATPAEEIEKAPSEEDQATLSTPAEQENTGADEKPAAETTVPTASPEPTGPPVPSNEIGAVVISSDDKSAANIAIPFGSKLADYAALDKYKVFAEADRCTLDSVKWELTDKKAETPAEAETVFTAGNKYICTVSISAKTGFVFGTTSAFTMNGVAGTTESTDTAKRDYKFAFTVPAAPTAEPATGATVKADATITLTAAEGAVISYKANTDTEWSVYAADKKVAVKADADKKFKVTAKAVLNGFESAEAVFDYTVDPTVTLAPPTASPAAGTYTEEQTVTLKAEDGASIRYTTDGTDPTKTEGTLYSKAFTISKDTTVKAIAYTDNGISSVAQFKYVIKKEPEKKAIKKVSVLDVTGAARGVIPKEDASVSDSSHSIVESVEWTDTEKNALDTSKVFKAGTIYYVYIHLMAEDGYVYDVDALKANSKDNVVATINGNRASVSSVSERDLVILGAFKTADAVKADGNNSTITGLSSAYAKGATITFTATGAGSTNPEKEGNERYIPVKYSVSSNSYDITDGTPSVKRSIRISTSGTYTLKVTFQKEVYSADKNAWVKEDDTHDKTASLKINTSGSNISPRTTTKAATNTPKANSDKSKSAGAKTGDETPVGAFVGLVVLAGAAVVVLAAAKKKKSKSNK